ncbi:MAG: hypothetical protein BA863_06565 [Desulfovibrio sp. S3730MH75]|nr:MAG: hypothetical protein BA863_06565 [Desulfovibrio sp. S3730MH75]
MHRRPEAGFTLLEVMIAMTILAVGLTAVVSVFSRSTAAISEVESFERAGMEARMRLAQFLNEETSAPAIRKGECESLPDGQWNIEAKSTPDNPGVSIVTVNVLFNAGGRQRILTMKTAQVDFSLPLRIENKQDKDI